MLPSTRKIRPLLRILFAIALCGGIGYWVYLGYKEFIQLRRENGSLQTEIASLESSLSSAQEESDLLHDALTNAQQTLVEYQNQIDSLTGTVGSYEKLSRLDPELLKKYSKVYFLNEHYIPSSLSAIDTEYITGGTRKLQIHTRVWPKLRSLLRNAREVGIPLEVTSAYRSFAEQKALKSGYKITYGAGTANQFSAEQGYSEHQLGTTVDFTTTKTGGNLNAFEKTTAFPWLQAHAYEYGFVLSYPKNNTYYRYEPWHWRYVGLDLAKKLHDDGTYLYGLDQREIDGYLISIFD